MVKDLIQLAAQIVKKTFFTNIYHKDNNINLDNKNCNPLLLWLTIYTHHLPRLTFYFDWRWDSKWHFCHKLQLRKWLHDVKLFFVLVTNVLLKCEKLKENMSWCEAWRKLRTSSFSFLLWHDGFGYNYGMRLCIMFKYMTYQRKMFWFGFTQSFMQ